MSGSNITDEGLATDGRLLDLLNTIIAELKQDGHGKRIIEITARDGRITYVREQQERTYRLD